MSLPTKYSHALSSVRHRYEAKAQRVERGVSALASGYVLAELSKRSVLPVKVFGVPSVPLLGAALLVVAAKSSGATRRIADSAGDACLAVYGYRAGLAGSFVAGDMEGAAT